MAHMLLFLVGMTTATLYRMQTDSHICPFGLKAKDLLEREGFEVQDRPLESLAEADAFKEKFGVETTPQVFIEGRRVGGYDALRQHLGKGPEKSAGCLWITPVSFRISPSARTTSNVQNSSMTC